MISPMATHLADAGEHPIAQGPWVGQSQVRPMRRTAQIEDRIGAEQLAGVVISRVSRSTEIVPRPSAPQVGDTVHLTLYHEGTTRQVEFSLPERTDFPAMCI